MAMLMCDCGQQYEIRDDTPSFSPAWIVCPRCYLGDQ